MSAGCPTSKYKIGPFGIYSAHSLHAPDQQEGVPSSDGAPQIRAPCHQEDQVCSQEGGTQEAQNDLLQVPQGGAHQEEVHLHACTERSVDEFLFFARVPFGVAMPNVFSRLFWRLPAARLSPRLWSEITSFAVNCVACSLPFGVAWQHRMRDFKAFWRIPAMLRDFCCICGVQVPT